MNGTDVKKKTMMNINLVPSHDELLESSSFTQEDTLSLQIKLWELLARRTSRYTMDDSSSVPNETAEELLKGICFTLRIDQNSTPAFLQELLHANLDERYQFGLQSIEQKIAGGKQLWQTACLSSPKIENISLSDTLKSIGTFWKRYDYRFFAHQIPCDIDYQLCHPVPEILQGVDYVNEYLRHILIESDFLRRFDSKRCVQLLQSYCPDYKGLLINLYEPVAVNAIGLALIGGNVASLDITDIDRKQIKLLLEAQSSNTKTVKVLKDAAKTLCNRFNITNVEARCYLEESAVNLCPRIQAALPAGNLQGVFLSFDGKPYN